MIAPVPKFNFFMLFQFGSELQIKRLGVEQDLQKEMTTEFERERAALFADFDEIAFQAGYQLDDDEVFVIKRFNVPESLVKGAQSPTSVEVLGDGDLDWNNLKSIYASRYVDGKPDLVFQSFERNRLLAKRFSIILSDKTFSRLTDPGVMLATRAAAVYTQGNLYFRAFNEARRIFDLAMYYREATAKDLEAFTESDKLAFEDSEAFINAADSVVRRRVALISDSNLLNQASPTKLRKVAKGYSVPIQFKGDRIVVPKGKMEMKELLRFLDENYYTSDLSGRQFISSSKRPLKARQ